MTPLSGTGSFAAGCTSSRSRVSSAIAGSPNAVSLLNLAFGRRPCDREFCVRRGPAEDQARAVGLGQADLGDAAVGEVDDAAVEPACHVIGKIERAAGEPRLRVAGLSDVDAVIAGAEPIVAPLADDQPGERRPGFVLEGDQGRFAVARIFDLETRVEIGLSRLRLDQSHVGQAEHDPANFARRRPDSRLFARRASRRRRARKSGSSRCARPRPRRPGRACRRDRGSAVRSDPARLTPGSPVASATMASATSTTVAREQQDQAAFLHGTPSRLAGRVLLTPRPRDGGAA